jgi:hypothetical protein
MNSINNGQALDKKRIIHYGSVSLGVIIIIGCILSSVILRDNLFLLEGVPYAKFGAIDDFNSVEMGENNIYLFALDGVETIDLNSTLEHNFTSFDSLGGDNIQTLAYRDDVCFVRNYTGEQMVGEIRTYDLSDSLNHTLLSTWEFNNSDSYDIFLLGNVAFVAGGVDGLEIVNISDLSNPSYIGGYTDSSNESISVYVQDDIAYVGDSEGLDIIDVSDISNPASISRYEYSGDIIDMQIEADVLYITGKNETWLIEMIDVTDPSDPVYIGELIQSNIYPKFEIVNQTAYIGMKNDFFAFDVSDTSNPSPIARHHFGLGFHIVDLHVIDGIAYVLEEHGLYFVDLTVQPFTITLIGWTVVIGTAVAGSYFIIIGLYLILKGDNPLISFLINLVFLIFFTIYVFPMAINLEVPREAFPYVMPLLVFILEAFSVASFVTYFNKRKISR